MMKNHICRFSFLQWILLLIGIFEVICVPAYFLHFSLTSVMIIYIAVCVIVLIGIIKTKSFNSKKFEIKKPKIEKFSIMDIVALLLVLFQVFLIIFFQHTDADDAWYVGNAATILDSNQLFVVSPYSGNIMDFSYAKDYILSPLPVFWAICAKILNLHPTIFIHSIVPIVMVILAYSVYFALGKELLENRRDTTIFLILVSILNLFGFYSTRTTGVFLLFRIWQGKAIFCTILIPLWFCFVLRLFKKEDNFKEIISLFLLSFVSCLVSFTAVILMLPLTGAYALTYAIAKKNIKIPCLIMVSCIPNMILFVIYCLI